MGAVYRARSGAEEVALKVVHPAWAGQEEFRRRFRREVVISQLVTGPGVARLLDFDLEADIPWLATELVSGPTLAVLVTDTRPLRGPALRELAVGTVRGLIDLHSQGVVHRDIKPANIIVARRGPVLVDFGIAAAVELTAITNTGSLLGSAGWMSPEQVSGGQVGPASDVFSWATTMAYAATGRSPYGTGRPDAIAYRVRHEAPDLTGVPTPLAALLEAALAKDPATRPTAPQVADALDAMGEESALTQVGHHPTLVELAGEPTHADADPYAPKPQPSPPRRARSTLVVVAAAMVAFLVAGTLWWQGRPAEGDTHATTAGSSGSTNKESPPTKPASTDPAAEPSLPELTATIDPRRPATLARLGTFLDAHVQETVRLDLLWTPTLRGSFAADQAAGTLSAIGACPPGDLDCLAGIELGIQDLEAAVDVTFFGVGRQWEMVGTFVVQSVQVGTGGIWSVALRAVNATNASPPASLPTGTAQEGVNLPTTIPAGFPLNIGQRSVDLNTGETSVPTPTRDSEGPGTLYLCSKSPVVTSYDGIDRLVSVATSGEYMDARELVLFADATEAVNYLNAARAAVTECPSRHEPGDLVEFTPHDYSTGYDDFYFSDNIDGELCCGTYQYLRVGAAVLVRYTGGEVAGPADDESLEFLARDNLRLARRMCLFALDGCA